MSTQSYLLYLLIVGCEIAFWLVLLLSLAARYLLKKERLSRWLLRSLPLIDLLLLVFTAWDLRAGTPATLAHGLAAVYVGFTLAFGSTVIRWADENFAFRFASGPPPASAPTSRWSAVRFDAELWFRCIGAWIIALVLIEALTAFVDNEAITAPLRVWYKVAVGGVFFWFVFGPVWSLVFFRRKAR